MTLKDEALALHKHGGKLEVRSKVPLATKKDLSLAYTPGVADVCREIAKHKELAYTYTIKRNSVAVVSDGSAVLGLGNIGAEAAMPVMEGKAAIFKEMAGIDAYPIVLNSQDASEIVRTVKNIAPGFGGINLEDISAPKCFDVERELLDIGIPVMHDDQHGTAIVILAALMNAARVVGKPIPDLKVVVNGAGAAGSAVTKLLLCMGVDRKICVSVREIIVCDSKGAIYEGRPDLNTYKKDLAKFTNGLQRKGSLGEMLKGADVFIGVSTGNVLTADMIQGMNKDPIVFAMANPTPEIAPEEGINVSAVFGTGRSDYANQINNSLAFPGVFKGALDAQARKINNEMKIAAAHAIATFVTHPTKENILPSTLDKDVHLAVAKAVKKAAMESGVGTA